ncbi:MAG: tail fiber domain-containing protein [Dysgonamonadaceae bacterium]|nr:tail fiber domain-containing protein [Dysgonamonadaceae bacterium]
MKVIQKLKVLITLMALMMIGTVQAQVKIGQDAEPVKGAVLELNSTTGTGTYIGGLRLPNVSLTNVNLIPSEFSDKTFSAEEKEALEGTIVYNTNPSVVGGNGIGVYYWNKTKWIKDADTNTTYTATNGLTLPSSSTTFELGGNLTKHTIITTNSCQLLIGLDNTNARSVTFNNGNLGIGVNPASGRFQVAGGHSFIESLSVGTTIRNTNCIFQVAGGDAYINEKLLVGKSLSLTSFYSQFPLQVDGNAYINAKLLIGNTFTSTDPQSLQVSGNAYIKDDLSIGITSNPNNYKLNVSGNSYMNGNLGIRINPQYPLHVQGDAVFQSNNVWFNSNGLTAAPNLGIGVAAGTTPDARVHVKGGDILIENNIPYLRLSSYASPQFTNTHNILGGVLFGRNKDMTCSSTSTQYIRPFAAILGLEAKNADGTASGKLEFRTTKDQANEEKIQMTIDGFGNVGIGTESPTHKLHIVTDGTKYKMGSTAYNPIKGFRLVDGNENKGYVLTTDDSGIATWEPAGNAIEPWYKVGSSPAAPSTLNTDDSYLMANVGIGEKDPKEKLHVNGNFFTTQNGFIGNRLGVGSAFTKEGTRNHEYYPNGALQIFTEQSPNTPLDGWAARIVIQSVLTGEANWDTTDSPNSINFVLTDKDGGPNLDKDIGSIIFLAANPEGVPESYHGARMDAYQRKDSKNKYFTEFRILADSLHLFSRRTISANQRIQALGFDISSDARLKTNVIPVKYGLSEVMKLKPVNYEMKDKLGVERVGFIAQEVKEVIPELVVGTEGDLDKGETLSIAYSELIPVLTKAIQEQQKIIEQLEARLKALETAK